MFSRLPHSPVFSLGILLCLLLHLLLLTGSAPAPAAVVKDQIPAASSGNNQSAELAYQKAADLYHRLLQNPSAAGGDSSRKEWLKVSDELEKVYRQYPQSRTASASLYLAARLRIGMYQQFRHPADQDQALALFHNVVSLFPESNEAANSLYSIAEIEQVNGNLRGAAKKYYKLIQDYPLSPRRGQAEQKLNQLTAIAKSLAAHKNGSRLPANPPIVSSAPVQAERKISQPTLQSGLAVTQAMPVSPKPEQLQKPTIKFSELQVAEIDPIDKPRQTQKQTQTRLSKPVAAPAQSMSGQKPVSSGSQPAARSEQLVQPPPVQPVKPLPAVSSKQKQLDTPKINVSDLKIAETEPVDKPEKIHFVPVTPPENRTSSAPAARARKKKTETVSSTVKIIQPHKPEQQHGTTGKLTISALEIAETEPVDKPHVTLPEQTKSREITPAPKPKSASKEPEKPATVQLEESKKKESFWDKILPDFMFGSNNDDQEAEEPGPQAAATSHSTLKTASDKAGKEKKIVVSDLQIAAGEPEPLSAAASNLKQETLKSSEPPLVDLLLIQHWSSDHYSRVAINASSSVIYHVDLPDRSSSQPGTLRIDFEQARATPEVLAPMLMKSGLVKSIYTQQRSPNAVRIFLELATAADCKIFSLNDPFRLVIDIRSLAKAKPAKKRIADKNDKPKPHQDQPKATDKNDSAAQKNIKTAHLKDKKTTEAVLTERNKATSVEPDKLTLAQQLGLGIRRIVIDPGHGGKDTGATGFGLKEKNIVLKVAKRVKKILKRENYEVFLTREKDVFIPLEERTAIANTKEADLFLSIHVNAHPKSWVRGVETFYLNLAANPEAMRVAALENATSSRSMSEMEDILTDLMKNTKINESSQLAEFIQTSMAEGLRRYKIRSLGVKKAPFYVLIGAQMPAALVEVSFITNENEAKLLKKDRYIQTISEQIAAGVIAYIEHRRTAATAALHMPTSEERM